MARRSGRSDSGRHRWVFQVLERSGSTRIGEENGVYTYRVGADLAGSLGRKEIRFTFRKRQAAADGVELALPGSWLHDRLISYATSLGQVTRCYLRERPDLDREAVVKRRRRDYRAMDALQERRYGTMLLFSFRISFYAEPPRQSVWTVAFDCDRGRVIQRAPTARSLEEAWREPRRGLEPPPPVDAEAAFEAAWASLQNRVDETLQVMEREGRPYMEREIQAMERYYRQLIAEERRIEKTRASRKGQEESRRKIELLKLEWERRVKQETERLRPQAVARLSAVAEIHSPLERWTYRSTEGEDGSPAEVWIDLARGDAWVETGSPGKRNR